MSLEYLPISVSASGETVLRAGLPGLPIRVMAYTLVCAEAVSVKFTDGETDLTGAMPFGANGGASVPFSPRGHFVTPAGVGLSIHLSDAVAVAGHMLVQIGGALR